ncbi:cytochrome P450 94B1 [Capsicum annuum]|uniref:cytochrome P450 94B1 n=1 Tax=Capsicum annuum TaxID=4072 RepID=UPI001FB0DD4B|nr:cytochrome P450 94B1 [Capsicum annuum]
MQKAFSFSGLFGNLVNEIIPSYQEQESNSVKRHENGITNNALANENLRALPDAEKSAQRLSTPLFPEVDAFVKNQDCGVFVSAYAEILSEEQQVHSCGFDAGTQCAHYASLLWHYGMTKEKEGYTSDNEDPPRPRNSYLQTIDENVLRRFAFDTICKVSLGTDPHCLEDLSHVPILVDSFDTASRACAMRGMAPVYAIWKSKRALNLGSEKTLKENVKRVHCCINDIIEKKKQTINENGENSKNMDLLSRLLIAGHEDEVVRDMVISFLMAGRDTTSSALTWLFWLMTTNHDDVKNEMINEITSINYGDKALEFDELREMKYLQACLNESMRLYPPVAWDSKHAAKDDILPDGTRVQKGNRVTYFPYGMGRMEEIWGKDRLEFKPNRWIDENGELKSVCPYKFPVFQAGPRVCLGKEMAFTQMKYVLASVLRRFEIKPVNAENPAFVPLLTAHMVGGLNVRLYHRGS